MTTPEPDLQQDPEQTEGERLRRAEPERTEPNRAGANVFLSGTNETVDAGVNTAYRVIGDYLRRGQEAARKQEPRADGRGNPWSSPGGPWAAGMSAIPTQLFRAWADMLAVWADMTMIPAAGDNVRAMTRLVEDFWAMTGMIPGREDGSKAAEDQDAAAASPARVNVAIEVASDQVVEVELDFCPPAGVVPALQKLHPLRGEAPALAGLAFEYDARAGRAKLALAVPRDQAPGRYAGTIFDDRDDRACGSVRVRIGD